jgi:hypothetical protein
MTAPRSRAGRCAAPVAALLAPAVGALPPLAGEAAAQGRSSLTDPGTAHLRRDLRSRGNRAGSGSPGADVDLQRARRELLRQGRGVYFTPEQARIDRELNRLRRGQVPPGQKLPPELEEPPNEPLPRSYGEDGPLPSMRRGLVTATRLLDRAEAALTAGRPVQARSDLASARGFLDGVPADAADTAEDRAALRGRMDGLEARLATAEAD